MLLEEQKTDLPDHDVVARRKEVIHQTTTYSAALGPLARASLSSLETFFKAKHHKPSEAMWTALTAILTTLEAMADTKAAPVIHVSSLDPGVGKTQAMLAFLKALLSVGYRLPVTSVLLSTGPVEAKAAFLEASRTLKRLGLTLFATRGTAGFLRRHGIDTTMLHWPLEAASRNVMVLSWA